MDLEKARLIKETGIKLRHSYVAIIVGCSPASRYYVAEMDIIGHCYLLIWRTVNAIMEIHLNGFCPQSLVKTSINTIEEGLQWICGIL